MKRTNKLFKHLGFALVMGSLLVGCGKDNKSGQSSQWGINGLGGPGTWQAMGGISNSVVNAAVNENTCLGGQSGIYSNGGQQRYAIQFNITSVTGIASGDYYVGATSYGDVAVIVGQGVNQPALFIGYVCTRGGMAIGGAGQQPGNVALLAYSNCEAKTMNASMYVEGFLANFRTIAGGTSRGVKFSFCR